MLSYSRVTAVQGVLVPKGYNAVQGQ